MKKLLVVMSAATALTVMAVERVVLLDVHQEGANRDYLS